MYLQSRTDQQRAPSTTVYTTGQANQQSLILGLLIELQRLQKYFWKVPKYTNHRLRLGIAGRRHGRAASCILFLARAVAIWVFVRYSLHQASPLSTGS
jgi:hypothetical protein